MGITLSEQMCQVFFFLGMGFILGLYYDVFRVFRLYLEPPKYFIFILDLLYFVTASIATFLFSLAISDGVINVYFFAALAIGFLTYRVTIGLIIVKFVSFIIAWLVKTWNIFWKIVHAPFNFVLKKMKILAKNVLKSVFLKIKNVFTCHFSKLSTFIKNSLQLMPLLLYNRKGNKK